MPSIAEQICQRVEAVLMGATSAGLHVWRDRNDALTREESPAILIEALEESISRSNIGGRLPGLRVEQATLVVLVTICVRSTAWQAVTDQVRIEAHRLLSADPVLNGFEIARQRCEWRSASADLPFGYASQQYSFTYLSKATDLA